MRIVYIFIALCMGILAFAKGSSIDKCDRVCTKIYKPVCAALKKGPRTTICTFANKCILDNVMCRQKQTWKLVDANKKCKRDSCNCRDLF